MRNKSTQSIAVVYGGYSPEWEISIQSGKSVAGWLRNAGRTVYEVLITPQEWAVTDPSDESLRYPIEKGDFSFTRDGEKIRPDKAFIMIHGDPGENGRLQAYFELIDMPFVGCTSLCTTIAFDKYACKSYLQGSGICMAADVMVRKDTYRGYKDLIDLIETPCFVKPTNGGSSFGVTKVKTHDMLDSALEAAFRECGTVLVEEAVTGREIDCGVYTDKDGIHALPLIEIVPEKEFFDYEAKYLGACKEICPAPISGKDTLKIQEDAIQIYRRLGCKGLVRMDFILTSDGCPYFLELNPNPGMTAASLVPQMVRQTGMTMEDFLTRIIDCN